MARLAFLGAARTVTGSQYLVESGGQRLMVDCGMFQGERLLRQRNWARPVHDPASMAGLVLTHTHLDHIGRVPRLVQQGFRGTIFCTPPTRDLAEVIRRDAARLQQEDAEDLNRKGRSRHTPALPLFDDDDVDEAVKLFRTVPLARREDVSARFSFSFQDAGHLLGAASVDLRILEGHGETRILFSGDVGRFGTILARDPELAPAADYMVVEGTYGNRAHPTVPLLDQLEGVLKRTFARGGVVIIPAFAVGRAQQMIYLMDRLVAEGRLPPFPIHLDSPMAIEASRVYAQYPESHGVSVAREGGGTLFHGEWVRLHRTRAESMALNDTKGPAVILSSSGTLSGGRVLHHCRHRLPGAENTLLITGYQGQGTLGRALLDGAKVVRIHKREVPALAEVAELRGLSGHADAGEVLRWLSGVQAAPRRVFVTHGEEEAAEALAAKIAKERGFPTQVPYPEEAFDL